MSLCFSVLLVFDKILYCEGISVCTYIRMKPKMFIQTGNTVLNLKLSMKDLVAHLAQIERSVSN